MAVVEHLEDLGVIDDIPLPIEDLDKVIRRANWHRWLFLSSITATKNQEGLDW